MFNLTPKFQHPQTAAAGKKAQSTLEFTFSMVVFLLLMYGMMMAFRWVGVDLGERRIAHEGALLSPVNEGWSRGAGDSSVSQLDPNFYSMKKMGLVFNQW